MLVYIPGESRNERLSELERTSGTTWTRFPICVEIGQTPKVGKGLGNRWPQSSGLSAWVSFGR